MKKSKVSRILKRIIGIICCIVAALAILWAVTYFHRSDPAEIRKYETDNPLISESSLISAHRSGAGIMPEETMRAFVNCIENKEFTVGIFEFDLHITKDDVLILLHDDELDRTSDCAEVFGKQHCHPEDYTYEELRQLNMGAKFVNENGEMPFAGLKGDEVPDDIRIADLKEVIGYLEKNGNFHYIVEVKNKGDLGKKSVDLLVGYLDEMNLTEKVIFGNFDAEISMYAEEKYPELTRGACVREVFDFFGAYLLRKADWQPAFEVLQLPFGDISQNRGVNLGTASLINYAHQKNLAVQYWTVNNEKDMEYLISLKADGIITDYPDRAYRKREAAGK